ncbi:MAG TPA: cobalamin-binding protein [Chloroflexi bacterium]|nr:cobalamin-binding protein [Chloroflexota bacterium]
MDENLKPVYEAILEGDMGGAKNGVQAALAADVPAADLLHKALIPAMGEVGRLFEDGEYFVPEMLIAARAMKAGLEILKPLLVDSGVEPVGKVAIGTVKGDLHDIGKNLVAMMMEGAGFEIMDLGTDVSPEKFVEAAQNGADIIGLSALLTTTMPSMETTVKAIVEAGLRDQVKIIIGGAPVTVEYAQRIGADGYASDASQAASLAKGFMA